MKFLIPLLILALAQEKKLEPKDHVKKLIALAETPMRSSRWSGRAASAIRS